MCKMSHERKLQILILRALGGVEESAANQLAAIDDILGELNNYRMGVRDKARVEWAEQTRADRIKESDPRWGVHMSHCYGWDYDSIDYHGGQPKERFSCKYGEDDICPAALHEDPWSFWVAADMKAKGGK